MKNSASSILTITIAALLSMSYSARADEKVPASSQPNQTNQAPLSQQPLAQDANTIFDMVSKLEKAKMPFDPKVVEEITGEKFTSGGDSSWNFNSNGTSQKDLPLTMISLDRPDNGSYRSFLGLSINRAVIHIKLPQVTARFGPGHFQADASHDDVYAPATMKYKNPWGTLLFTFNYYDNFLEEVIFWPGKDY